MAKGPRVHLPLLILLFEGIDAFNGFRWLARRTELRFANQRSSQQALSLSSTNATESDPTATESTSVIADVSTSESTMSLSEQVKQLKAEISLMQNDIALAKEQQLVKEEASIDKWIRDLFFVGPSSPSSSNQVEDTQLLKTVDQVAQSLEQGRYSAEQVHKIFRRLTLGIPKERIEQSLEQQPLLQLLVEACGRLDCLERHENANKRWNGRVERALRKKLLAMEWGIDWEDDIDMRKDI